MYTETDILSVLKRFWDKVHEHKEQSMIGYKISNYALNS